MNKIIVIGRLVRDPILTTSTGGTPICNFTVAVNGQSKPGVETTDYFKVSAFGKTAENCSRFLTKGREVCVEGRISLYTYVRQDGNAGASMDITARDVTFLGSPRKADEAMTAVSDDPDMPF